MIYLEHRLQIGLPAFEAINDFLIWYVYNPWTFERRAFAVLHGVKADDVKIATKRMRHDVLV
jgi:hypothetical protein